MLPSSGAVRPVIVVPCRASLIAPDETQTQLKAAPNHHRPFTWPGFDLLLQVISQDCLIRGCEPMVCMLVDCCGLSLQQCMPFWVVVRLVAQHNEALRTQDTMCKATVMVAVPS